MEEDTSHNIVNLDIRLIEVEEHIKEENLAALITKGKGKITQASVKDLQSF